MHEGGELGEGVVKELWAQCPQAVRDGWSQNLIKKYYCGRAMKAISRDVEAHHPEIGIPKQVLAKFKQYKSEHEVRSTLQHGVAGMTMMG
jgi:hypothetical protein